MGEQHQDADHNQIFGSEEKWIFKWYNFTLYFFSFIFIINLTCFLNIIPFWLYNKDHIISTLCQIKSQFNTGAMPLINILHSKFFFLLFSYHSTRLVSFHHHCADPKSSPVMMNSWTLNEASCFEWHIGCHVQSKCQGCAGGAMAKGLKWEIREPSLNTSQVCYINIDKYLSERYKIHHFFP